MNTRLLVAGMFTFMKPAGSIRQGCTVANAKAAPRGAAFA